MAKKIKKIYRSREDRIIAGVAGGLGEYLGIDPVLFRILFVVFLLIGSFGFWLYLILILVIPLESKRIFKK